MFSKQNITYFLMALIIIWAFGYMAYGEETLPSPKDIALQQRARLLEEQSQIDRDNLKILSYCNEYASWAKADEKQKAQYDCYRTQRIPDIDIPAIESNSWTVSTAKSVLPSWIKSDRTEELERLNKEVCKKNINSPICERETFYRLYKITEERLPWKNFFPILLGITNAESSLGTAYAKNNKGWYCTGYNNLGWIKYRKTDDGKSVRDQKIPDSNGCYLYKFDSIDDYWISKVNTIRYGYKGCVNSTTPIKCMSYAYVGDKNVSEASWVRNVSIFLP